ncbi:MAG: glycosyltransferase involved in cell wall biosynthesis [Marivirga sp.]|jgi:glycosyltransferase involved in cell wall biosynthesis
MRIFAAHLLNDYSGSPKVLMQLIKGWQREGHTVHLHTSARREGFLSNILEISRHTFWYRLAKNPYIRLIFLCWSQLMLFFQLFVTIKKEDIVYVNTVLPFGAALAGKIKGSQVIYHIHETSIKPLIFKKILFYIIAKTADKVIYVSKYLAENEPVKHVKSYTLHNALPEEFMLRAKLFKKPSNSAQNALMVCSLKDYKGVNEFALLALDNPGLNFRLVLNATQPEVEAYFQDSRPANLTIYATQTDLHPHYQWADLILNLSRPDGWIETFGLTIIEAMAYSLPAIVPPIGGITELIDVNENGFQVNSRERELLNSTLQYLCQNDEAYKRMSLVAGQKLSAFTEANFLLRSGHILLD